MSAPAATVTKKAARSASKKRTTPSKETVPKAKKGESQRVSCQIIIK